MSEAGQVWGNLNETSDAALETWWTLTECARMIMVTDEPLTSQAPVRVRQADF